MDRLAGVEMPEGAAGSSFYRLQRSGVIAKKHQSTGGGQCPRPGIAMPDLGIAPNHFSIGQGEGDQDLLLLLIGRKLRAGAVVGLALNKRLRILEQ